MHGSPMKKIVQMSVSVFNNKYSFSFTRRFYLVALCAISIFQHELKTAYGSMLMCSTPQLTQ